MTGQILLSHGSGGKMSHELVEKGFLKQFSNPILDRLDDSAVIDFNGRLAFTTDSFVVSPIFFPGGDIGKLSVCGTVNDLSMVGALPLYLSLAFIIEDLYKMGRVQPMMSDAEARGAALFEQAVTAARKGNQVPIAPSPVPPINLPST